MVIAQDTEYVFLDEPTNNLDIYHASNMMKMVRKLSDELGKTVILVLHEINYAAFYSDYICAFKNGKIAKYGTVEEVIQKEVLSEIYQVDFEIFKYQRKTIIGILLMTENGRKQRWRKKMRKLAKVLLAGVAALSLTACGQAEGTTGSSADTTAKEQKQQETPEKIKIQSLNANGEEISLEVPYDPERIAVLDMAALDILDNLGVGDKIVGSASTSLEYLSDYVDNEKVANLGNDQKRQIWRL